VVRRGEERRGEERSGEERRGEERRGEERRGEQRRGEEYTAHLKPFGHNIPILQKVDPKTSVHQKESKANLFN
jgi:hypothetical protein